VYDAVDARATGSKNRALTNGELPMAWLLARRADNRVDSGSTLLPLQKFSIIGGFWQIACGATVVEATGRCNSN
jgi:hypothetical protein